jgi:hypothetical protein
LAKEKVSRPLYAAVVRIAAKSETFEGAWDILRDLAGALRVFCHPNGNELIPLQNDDYPFEAHVEDVVRRQTRRSGMLLNSEELIGFVHFPSSAVKSGRFARQAINTRPAPRIVLNGEGLCLGENIHAGEVRPVVISPDQRSQHTHIIGASGTGKSTLLFNLIEQDIRNGEGLAVLDPHGDLIDKILGIIPEERIEDVVLLDPADEEYSVGFNFLSAHSDLEKNLLASDLVSVFERLSSSWGDQLASVLRNAILAFLESRRRGTLSDLRRFLLDTSYRNEFLETVTDPDIVYYWRKGFTQLTGNKSVGPVLTRLDSFLAPKPIRYMVSQPENRIDFAGIMGKGKILLARLSSGAIGKENSYLLGSLLMAKFQQTAMSRQSLAASDRRNFWLYVDEFQNFITPSMAEILAESRKYRVGLILAHQELRQLERDRDVASAVMSHCYTRVAFRVSDHDAKSLEQGFASFEARDFQNLGTGEAICRVERSNFDFNLKVPPPKVVDSEQAAITRQRVVTASRQKYAVPRAEVESALHPKRAPDKKAEASSARPPKSEANPAPAKATQAEPSDQPKSGRVESPMPVPVPVPPSASDEPKASTEKEPSRHEEIKNTVELMALELGFTAHREKVVLDGRGRIDLCLYRGSRRIACQVSITTTFDHEAENAVKCQQAGFNDVVMISVSPDRLARTKSAVEKHPAILSKETIRYFLPDEFLSFLRSLKDEKIDEEPTAPSKSKVRLQAAPMTPDQRKAKEASMLGRLAAAMKAGKVN